MKEREEAMVDRNREERPDEENSAQVLKTQTYEDLRQIAKRNLKEAERVLAESGYQLHKNKNLGSESQEQRPKEPSEESSNEK